MRKKSLLLAAVLASLAMLTVAAPKLEFTWKNPNYTGGTFKNILVLALNGKAANRAEFEDELVAAITRPGAKAYPSYEFMPRPDLTPIDMNDMRELVKEQNFDAIVVAPSPRKTPKPRTSRARPTRPSPTTAPSTATTVRSHP
jgi:hypothetical protein